MAHSTRTEPPDAAARARLFLALVPDQATRAALAQHAASWTWSAHARLYAPADWHITLHFIGPVPRERVDALRVALDVAPTPFELRFGQAELWPHGLAVLLPMAVPEALRQLHALLGDALRRLDLPADERRYRPHVTLARHAAQAGLPPRLAAFDWPVQGYALVESTGRAQQRYRILQRYGHGV